MQQEALFDLVKGLGLRQATGHYLDKCWSRHMMPNGVTEPRWIMIGQKTMTALLLWSQVVCLGLILGLRPANETRRYIVRTSLIRWMQA